MIVSFIYLEMSLFRFLSVLYYNVHVVQSVLLSKVPGIKYPDIMLQQT